MTLVAAAFVLIALGTLLFPSALMPANEEGDWRAKYARGHGEGAGLDASAVGSSSGAPAYEDSSKSVGFSKYTAKRESAATGTGGGDSGGGGALVTDRVIPPIPIPPAGAPPPSSARYANGAANRSPPRPPVDFGLAARGGDELADSSASVSPPPVPVEAWGIGGSPARAPAWAPLLAAHMAGSGRLADLIALTEDPWRVLVGWVPSRFMGPQKVGKKANGDIMIPPTLGRDIGVYHKLYNSTWAVSFESGGYAYHFQIMHRNSLAVCIRERLHIHALHIRGGGGRGGSGEEVVPTGAVGKKEGGEKGAVWGSAPPVVVYHCPCRHCHEHTLEPPAGQQPLSVALPTYASPTATAGDAVMAPAVPNPSVLANAHATLLPPLPRPLEGRAYPRPDTSPAATKAKDAIGCLDPRSAPWLATPAAAPRFPFEGLYGDVDALLAAQADASGVVMVVMLNKFWIDHLHNFVFSLVHRASFANYVVATIDAETLALCVAARLPCWDATDLAEYEEDMAAGGAGQAGGATRKVTEAMSWVKPRLALAVLERGYHFIMADLDMSFSHNPMRDLVDIGFDIAHQCDAKDKFSINSGFYLARSGPRTIRFFRNLLLFTPQENSDQTAMKLFSRYDHTHGASNGCLDRRAFSMKCYYKIDRTVRRNEKGEETFEWRPFSSDRAGFSWRMHHATCLNGAANKVLYMRTIGAWFLDDLDAFTTGAIVGGGSSVASAAAGNANDYAGGAGQASSTYCVQRLLQGGGGEEGEGNSDTKKKTVQQPRSVSTVHSAKYSTATDPLYLEKRH